MKNGIYVAGVLWYALSIIGSGFLYCLLLDKSAYSPGFLGYKSLGLNCVIAIFYSSIIYVVMKQTMGLWRSIGPNGNFFLWIYDRIVVPLIAIFFPFGFEHILLNHNVIHSEAYFTYVVGAVLFGLLSDPFNLFYLYLLETGMLEKKGNSWLLLNVPPKKFGDVLPMFLIVHVVVIGVMFF